MVPSPAARPDAVRRHNLAFILGQIHRDGALTRAELTRRLGVSRSTIAALVTELIALDFVVESVPNGGSRAGRPSYVVGPHPDGPYVIAVDVNVTHVATAAVGIGGSLLARRTMSCGTQAPTPVETVDMIVAALRELRGAVAGSRMPIGLGVSVPGTVDIRAQVVGIAPNLGWRDVPLGALLHERIGVQFPIAIGNDADLSMLAEHCRGNARGIDDAVYLIGRTGVGAGIVLGGVPIRGRAGEVGHNVVDKDGPLCHCGKHGCLETFIGDAALLALAGRDGEPTTGRVAEVLADARAGDRRALAAVRTVAGYLGQAIGALVNTLNPQRVILGGSLSGVLELARPELKCALDRYAFDPGRPAQLRPPYFGVDSALLGASELALMNLLADPLG